MGVSVISAEMPVLFRELCKIVGCPRREGNLYKVTAGQTADRRDGLRQFQQGAVHISVQ